MNNTFEFDPFKSASNKAKHGIDFVEAQALWLGPFYEELSRVPTAEMRYANIGKIGDDHWTAIVTYRGFARRIISVYRSGKKQIDIYERTQRTRY